MSRDPGESPDEDGEPADQPAERSADPDEEPSDSADGDAGTTIHRLDDDQEEPAEGAGTESAESDSEPAESENADAGENGDGEPTGPVDGGDNAEDNGDEGTEAATVDEVASANEDEAPTLDEVAAAEEDEAETVDEDEEEDENEAATGDEVPAAEKDETETGDEEEEDEETASEPTTTPIERKTGPPEDEERPLTEHIEEMVKRVAVVLVIAGVVSLIAFPFGEDFINFLWYSVLPSDISKPHIYHPLELIVTQLKAASLLGLVVALPVLVYETYAFMRPGLYPNERRYYLAAVPTSLVLAFVGLLFGYFLILPAVMGYFMQYSRDVVDIAFALGDTFTLMLVLLGFLAVVFQIPLMIMLAIMMGLTSRTWLEDKRLIMWGVFLGIAFLFSPDPTGMAPFLVALTMVGLYEGTLLLLRWTGRGTG